MAGNLRTGVGFSANSMADSLDNNTGIGYDAEPTASNMVHIGNTSVSWIGGQVGWSTYSDARIKTAVQEDIPGLAFIKRLRPVSYQYDIDEEQRLLYGKVDQHDWDGKYDIENIRFSGFLAQEVEAAAQGAGYTFSGVRQPNENTKLYSLSYADFVVPLVKGMQELHSMMEEQRSTIESLRHENAQMKAQIDKISLSIMQRDTLNQ
jgi:hypothetical protein